MPTIRMLAPAASSSASTPHAASGINYQPTPGSAVDAPLDHAPQLRGQGWIWVCPSGPTAARPTPNPSSLMVQTLSDQRLFFDTTLGKVIAYDGKTWRDPSTGAAV